MSINDRMNIKEKMLRMWIEVNAPSQEQEDLAVSLLDYLTNEIRLLQKRVEELEIEQ